MLADNLDALFGQLMLEQDPWQVEEPDAGAAMHDAVEELADTSDPHARSAAVKLRQLVQATVLDWRGALEDGTIAGQRRLWHLAFDHAAENDDLGLLARLETLGCDPGEQIRNGLSPIDVALLHRSSASVRWLLERGVPVEHALQVGAHAVDLELARELLSRGALVNTFAITRAVDNEDIEVVRLLSQLVQPDPAFNELTYRLKMLATQAELAGKRATTQGDQTTARREQHRRAVLAELIQQFGHEGHA